MARPSPLAVLRVQKLKDFGSLHAAAGHQTRTRPTSNADPAGRIDVLAGSGDPAADARRLLGTLPSPPRRNAVLAIEAVLSASPSFFRPDDPTAYGHYDPERVRAWSETSLAWLRNEFGSDNVASVVLHLDEATPHLHAVIVPIDHAPKKRGRGPRLNAARWLDGGDRLAALQDGYGAAVAALGIERGRQRSKAQHRDVAVWYAEAPRAAAVARSDRRHAAALKAGLAAFVAGELVNADEVNGKRRLWFDTALPVAQREELGRRIAPAWDGVWGWVHNTVERTREQAAAAVENALAEVRAVHRKALDLAPHLTPTARKEAIDIGAALARIERRRQRQKSR